MANGLDAAEATIEHLLLAAFPTTPIAWPNVPFTPPTGNPWLRSTVQWGYGALSTKPGRQTIIGISQVEVYIPQAQGAGKARRIGDQIRAVFNSKDIDGVRFGVPSGPQQTQEEAPWYRRLVTTPFSVDELV